MDIRENTGRGRDIGRVPSEHDQETGPGHLKRVQREKGD